MWTDVRWRPPLAEAETDLLVTISRLLDTAYQMDPTLEYPWREWHEILGYLGSDSPLAAEIARRAAQTPDGSKIGYRCYQSSADRQWAIDTWRSVAYRTLEPA